MKARWADPKIRAQMIARHADPEVRDRISAGTKAALASPEARVRMSAAMQAYWADPETRSRRARDKVTDFAREHGCSRDIADDAIYLMEEEQLSAHAAIAEAKRYASQAG